MVVMVWLLVVPLCGGRRVLGGGGVGLCCYFSSDPSPRFVSWVKCKFVFWASAVSLVAFFLKTGTFSIVAGVASFAVRTGEEIVSGAIGHSVLVSTSAASRVI